MNAVNAARSSADNETVDPPFAPLTISYFFSKKFFSKKCNRVRTSSVLFTERQKQADRKKLNGDNGDNKKREVSMDITIDEMFRRLLIQMQKDHALSDEEKELLLKELESKINEEDDSYEKE